MSHVLTKVEPGRGYKIMSVADGELPVIYPPIILPAPTPGRYREARPDPKPLSLASIKFYWAYYRGVFQTQDRRTALTYLKNHIKADLRHRVFLFKMVHGITRDDRSWLFKS